ncbi:hypothetical protein QP275_12375, partial [Escherichia coli]|nr:hypothetical protein [Escherichia coli]
NQESRLPPGSDFRRWVWITIAPFVTCIHLNLMIFTKIIRGFISVTRVFNMLVNEGADLQIRRQSPHTLLIHVNRSGVTLWFEADEEQPGDPQNYMLMAFGLTHRDYDARFQYS